jgi:hypothetical protein
MSITYDEFVLYDLLLFRPLLYVVGITCTPPHPEHHVVFRFLHVSYGLELRTSSSTASVILRRSTISRSFAFT